MSDHGHGPSSGQGGSFDSEIDVRRILEIAAWLAAITVGAVIIGYFFYRGLGRWADRQDPAASPLSEASRAIEPPEPRLQLQPEGDLQALRRVERERLSSWGWVDKNAGIAHMPVEEAIARVAVPEPKLAGTTAPAPTPATTTGPAAAVAHEPKSGH